MAKITDYIGLPNASLFLVAEASAVFEKIDNNGDVIIADGAEMAAGPMFQEHYSGITWPHTWGDEGGHNFRWQSRASLLFICARSCEEGP